MSTQLVRPNEAPPNDAVPGDGAAGGQRFRPPPTVPPLSKISSRIFSVFWIAAFLLAIAGPIMGFRERYTEPSNNSQLLLGSHAGFAVSPRDATVIRYTIGAAAARAGIVPGDKIVAVYGLPLP